MLSPALIGEVVLPQTAWSIHLKIFSGRILAEELFDKSSPVITGEIHVLWRDRKREKVNAIPNSQLRILQSEKVIPLVNVIFIPLHQIEIP